MRRTVAAVTFVGTLAAGGAGCKINVGNTDPSASPQKSDKVTTAPAPTTKGKLDLHQKFCDVITDNEAAQALGTNKLTYPCQSAGVGETDGQQAKFLGNGQSIVVSEKPDMQQLPNLGDADGVTATKYKINGYPAESIERDGSAATYVLTKNGEGLIVETDTEGTPLPSNALILNKTFAQQVVNDLTH